MVLGIDASYGGFGIVAIDQDGTDTHVRGKWDKVKGPDRLCLIEDWLIGIIAMLPPVLHIAMENYAPGSKWGRELAGELGGLVKKTLH